jgi:hypothetical protein
MTNEERDIITQFIARVGGAPAQPSFGGSVPATQAPPAAPVDRDAAALIAQQFQRYPEAPYRMTQLAFVQEQALIEAQSRLKRLEWELQQAQQAAQQAQQDAQQRSSGGGGGFFSGLFGGASRPAAPQPPQGGPSPAWNQGAPQPQQPYYQQQAAPPPQYPPNYQPGVFQRQGSGFLGSALTTAAGVAGGLVAGEALMGLFSGHHGYGGDSFGGGGGGWGGGAPGGSPWGAPPVAPGQDYVDTGAWDNSGGAPAPSNQDYVDNGTWDQPAADDSSSWSDNSGGGGGGSDDDTF